MDGVVKHQNKIAVSIVGDGDSFEFSTVGLHLRGL